MEKLGNSDAFADWDSWVDGRIASRSAAMTAVMKASGLNSPLPGLADMNGQGTFTPCAPYGTCWQPTNGWTQVLLLWVMGSVGTIFR